VDVEYAYPLFLNISPTNSEAQRNRLHLFPGDGRFVVGGWETRDESCFTPHIFRPFSTFPIQGAKETKFDQGQAEY